MAIILLPCLSPNQYTKQLLRPYLQRAKETKSTASRVHRARPSAAADAVSALSCYRWRHARHGHCSLINQICQSLFFSHNKSMNGIVCHSLSSKQRVAKPKLVLLGLLAAASLKLERGLSLPWWRIKDLGWGFCFRSLQEYVYVPFRFRGHNCTSTKKFR